MPSNDLTIMHRKMILGVMAFFAWVTGFYFQNSHSSDAPLFFIIGWILMTIWVSLDARYRDEQRIAWTLLTLMTGPLAFIIYISLRKPAKAVCYRCGAALMQQDQICPSCGYQTYVGQISNLFKRIYIALGRSLSQGPTEQILHTTKHMAIALAGFVLFGSLLSKVIHGPVGALIQLAWILSVAAYWVLTAWWVYLDARWRRMDAIPWAILTLVTNVFGLVTYLVIRYPNPQTCPQCGAYLSLGLKRCPFCGSEAEPSCPRCQSPVKSDWIYCPSCAAQIPSVEQTVEKPQHRPPTMSVRGTVVDAVSGSPINGAVVRVDSKKLNISTETDATGRYLFTDLEPRSYVFIASAPGYAIETKAYLPNASIGPVQLHFSLYPVSKR